MRLRRRPALIAALLVEMGMSATGDARQPPQDSLDAPTETHVDLVAGLWHDDKFTPEKGWHRYHFQAEQTGYVAFQMKAPAGHPTVWSYIRVADGGASWAGVGNRETNFCEVIFEVQRGRGYDVIVTSQFNAMLTAGQRQHSDGPYTVTVVPLVIQFAR